MTIHTWRPAAFMSSARGSDPVKNGFLARSKSEARALRRSRLHVLMSIEDVTDVSRQP
jgi:hypothetical protein